MEAVAAPYRRSLVASRCLAEIDGARDPLAELSESALRDGATLGDATP